MSELIEAPSRFWVVRKPGETGTVVARFETTADDPSSIEYQIPDSCRAFAVPGRSALVDTALDPSVLTDEERQILGI